MPVLDGAQFARMLGPAAEIAFLSVDYGGVRRVVADAALPPAPGGLLLIRSDQIEALNARRVSASHRRIAAYLRRVAPVETSCLSSNELQQHVSMTSASGRELGLVSEQALGKWAYVLSKDHRQADRSLRDRIIGDAGRDVDANVARLVNEIFRNGGRDG